MNEIERAARAWRRWKYGNATTIGGSAEELALARAVENPPAPGVWLSEVEAKLFATFAEESGYKVGKEAGENLRARLEASRKEAGGG